MPTRIHLLLLGALAVAATAAPAQTKMFKCLVAGRTVYQQTQCADAAAPEKEEAKPAARAASAPRRAASAASGAAPGKTVPR